MITNELIEKWRNEWSPKSEAHTSYVEYFVQRAYEHGKAQRDAELMGVEPDVWKWTNSNTGGSGYHPIKGHGNPEFAHLYSWEPRYTATQLATERLQGAKDERKKLDAELEFAKSVAFGDQEHARVLTRERDLLERVNQGLLGTLKNLLALHDNKVDTAAAWNSSMEDARAAIAAAEQENGK